MNKLIKELKINSFGWFVITWLDNRNIYNHLKFDTKKAAIYYMRDLVDSGTNVMDIHVN